LEKAEKDLSTTGRGAAGFSTGSKKKKEERELTKLTKDSSNISVAQLNGVMNQVVKHSLFDMNPQQ